MTSSSAVSFCIITNGKRVDTLRLQLESIQEQCLTEYEILIAGNPPPGLNQARVLSMPEEAASGLLGKMRNALAHAARFPILVMLDDDILLDANCSTAALKGLEADDMVGCRVLNPDGSRYWDWAVRTHSEHKLIDYEVWAPDVYVTGGLCAIKRETARNILWNEDLSFYQEEDVDFSQRALQQGYRIGFCQDAVALHMDQRYTRVGNSVIRFTELNLRKFLPVLLRLLLQGRSIQALRTMHVWADANHSRVLQKLSYLGLFLRSKLEILVQGVRSRIPALDFRKDR